MSAERRDDEDAYLWDQTAPRDPDVERMERALEPLRSRAPLDLGKLPERAAGAKVVPIRRRLPRLAVGAALVGAAAVWAFVVLRAPDAPPIAKPDDAPVHTPSAPVAARPAPPAEACREGAGPGFAFEVLEGGPVCAGAPAPSRGTAQADVWLETPAGARVRVAIPEIGRVDFAPGSRFRVRPAEGGERRMELVRGKLHAKIDAAPRVFFVETPSAIAVDLGCEYELEIDDAGGGKLTVLTGFVALEATPKEVWASGPARSTLVPRGAHAAILPDRGPGIPVWSREPTAVQDAARRFDVHPETDEVFETLFAGLGERDTLTLVHLLDRVDGERRRRVLERLETVEKPPAGSRSAILAGDAKAIGAYRERLTPRWFPK
jgi:ferric-dicitrate binding protein FerR (iron transport regulator)